MMPTNAEYLRFLPEIILTLTGILIMFLEAVLEDRQKGIFAPLSIVGMAAALVAAATADPGAAFHDMLIIDTFGTFFRVLVIGVGILVVFSSSEYLARENSPGGEFYALLLFSVMGQCVMVTANELIMIFIGLEISSISSYILAGYLRDDVRNNESALKYFLLGSFATAFLLYGVAWIYGITATTNLEAVRHAIETPGFNSFALAGVAAALIFV
jgi:NADH-quinone oxidoreductase subunit N